MKPKAVERSIRRVALMLSVGACGCEQSALFVPEVHTPGVTLLLTKRSGTADSLPIELFVWNGHPQQAKRLMVDRVALTRQSDGAPFRWVPQLEQPADRQTSVHPIRGNYRLHDRSFADSMGSDDLQEGETYNLVVEVGPIRVSGRTTLPRVPVVSTSIVGDSLRIYWENQPNVRFFAVQWSTMSVGTDTSVSVALSAIPVESYPWSPPRYLSVAALDENYAQFLLDRTRAVSGLQGGFGLFGAASIRVIDLRALLPTGGSAAIRGMHKPEAPEVGE